MRILGIETSCDETAAAVVEVNGSRCSVLSNVVASQTDIHAQYGGVVPEVAARSHVVRILPVVEQALQRATRDKRQETCTLLALSHAACHMSLIDLIAVTAGPGLLSALSVGLETARYLGYAWGVPVVATNHLAGHLYSPLLSNYRGPTSQRRSDLLALKFPALGLIVSGGHTELVFMKGHGQYKIIGETLDDAAGEAFDKIAKLLGLPYPGGPQLAALAERGNQKAYDFPRGMIGSKNFSFSFSGLKTSVLYFLKERKRYAIRGKQLADVCASVQAAIVDVLVAKTISAAKKYRVKTVLLGGGVAANKSLRKKLKVALQKEIRNSLFLIPDSRYCTDNAAMIAAAGYITYKRHGASHLNHLSPDPHLPLG